MSMNRSTQCCLVGEADLPVKQEHGGERGQRGNDLQRKHRHCFSRALRKPPDREECHDWDLPGHEHLPEMCGRTLVRLPREAGHSDVAEHDHQGGT